MSTTKTADTFMGRVKTARKNAGLSTIETAYRLRDHLPESQWKSYQWIHRLETGAITEIDADPVVVAALARVWNVPLAELSSLAAQSRSQIVRLLVTEEFKKPGSSTPFSHKGLTGPSNTGPGRQRAAA